MLFLISFKLLFLQTFFPLDDDIHFVFLSLQFAAHLLEIVDYLPAVHDGIFHLGSFDVER